MDVSYHDLDLQTITKAAKILEAVKTHRELRGHERCHEEDNKLYEACGLEPIPFELPPVCEHRAACDVYRSAKYNTMLDEEPSYRLATYDKNARACLQEIGQEPGDNPVQEAICAARTTHWALKRLQTKCSKEKAEGKEEVLSLLQVMQTAERVVKLAIDGYASQEKTLFYLLELLQGLDGMREELSGQSD